MANRRSLNEALSISPEKMAFIHEGKTAAETAAVTPSAPQPAVSRLAISEESPTEPQDSPPARPEKILPVGGRRRRGRGREEQIPAGDPLLRGMANLLVPLTTRLQPTTAAALKRAGLEQKLRGASPDTVQEIVEIAVADWLEDHDYL